MGEGAREGRRGRGRRGGGVRAAGRGVGGCYGSAIHTVALDEKCSQRATTAGKFTRITRARPEWRGLKEHR